MWIADGWKDYEVIDTSCGEKLERWGELCTCASRPTGYMEYRKKGRRMEKMQRALPPQQQRRGKLGIP